MAVTKIIWVLRNDFILFAKRKKTTTFPWVWKNMYNSWSLFFLFDYALRLQMKISRRKQRRSPYSDCGAGCGWLHCWSWESRKGVNYYQHFYCRRQMKKIILSAVGFFTRILLKFYSIIFSLTKFMLFSLSMGGTSFLIQISQIIQSCEVNIQT